MKTPSYKAFILTEEEKLTHECTHCWRREARLVRINLNYDDNSRKTFITTTHNFTWVCNNGDCIMYINLNKVKTWRRA